MREVRTSQLRVGDVVHVHGMRVRIVKENPTWNANMGGVIYPHQHFTGKVISGPAKGDWFTSSFVGKNGEWRLTGTEAHTWEVEDNA